ncbi:MAG: hypothetical protein J6I36_08215 [Bacteroidaceae bacterium]|nr:hypothetical protein [Bacteroidaceae bacterium]MBR1790774.1 hypothetical protein [Bacteroidaceae bacterium]
MKKNLFWMFAAILLCGAIALSCSKNDEETEIPEETTYNYYVQSSQLTYQTDDLSELGLSRAIEEEYTKAILKVANGSSEQDNAVITACDKVYESHKTKYAGKLSGSVTIMKEVSVNGLIKEKKGLKVYDYNF